MADTENIENPPIRDEAPAAQGDNPNKGNAKCRQRNRPKTRNQPRRDSEFYDSLKWVEPLKDPRPLETQYTTRIENNPAGSFDLRCDLPSVIAEPLCESYQSFAIPRRFDVEIVNCISESLHAQAYFKACKQLYSTLPAHEKSMLTSFKGVYYDTAEIPDLLAASLAGIGNFNSKVGEFRVKHGPMLFKQWLLKGLALDPATDVAVLDHSVCIWHDSASLAFVKDKARSWLEDLAGKEYVIVFDVDSNQVNHRTAYPLFDPDRWDPEDVTIRYPMHQDIKRVLRLLSLSDDDFKSIDPPASLGGETWEQVLTPLALEFRLDSASEMNEQFMLACSDYVGKHSLHLQDVFQLAFATSTEEGCSGQIVSVDNSQSARSVMPISDADMEFGYMFSPALSVDFCPGFVFYGQQA